MVKSLIGKIRRVGVLLVALMLSGVLAASASADVSPTSHDFGEVEAGETSGEITKTITLPDATPKLDFVLLVDLSGSYSNDLPNIKSLAPGILSALKADTPDTLAGLTTFIDFPFDPWGGSTDYAYDRPQDLTDNAAGEWTDAVDDMVAIWGNDFPESQYEGLYQTASGAGRDINGDGDYTDAGEIEPGLGISWRPDSTKVIAITTDASFHNPGDDGGWPGAGFADTVAALDAEGIAVIALKAPGATTQMDDIAAATGGSVQSTTSTSSDIAAAISAGIDEITADVSASITSCDPGVSVTLNVPTVEDVAAGEIVTTTESITVGGDADAGTYECVVTFTWGAAEVGTQTISFEVPGGNNDPDCDNAAPTVASLWPPNHKMVDVGIDVDDEDGDTVSVTVTGITQDEPVNAKGDGNFGPDGSGVGTDTASVRAERTGTKGKKGSNGRVYEISFSADDGNGGTCEGSVNVGVPHDKKKGNDPEDDGQAYDSTVS